MARNRPYYRPPGTTLQDKDDARRANNERRQALITKLSEAVLRRGADAITQPLPEQEPLSRDVEGYMAAIAAQPLHRLGQSEVAELTPTYVTLVRSAAEIAGRGSQK